VNRHAVANATLGYPGTPPNGGSQPRFYDFDDGVVRLVKWHPSPHGSKPCLNELVASRLGQLVGAPILRGGVVYVPAEVIPEEHRVAGAQPGFHFGVARMEGENFVPASHYAEIANASELPFAAVFLTWLAVGDHEGHNQFLQRLEIRDASGQSKTTKRFRLVDMGQAFGDFNWDANKVSTVPASYKLPPHLAAKLNLASLAPAFAELGTIHEADIRACFEDCPQEWEVSSADKQAAVARLLAARQLVEEILRAGNPEIK
jgi:hypothetical protein